MIYKTTLQNIIEEWCETKKNMPQFFVITDPAIYDSVSWCRNASRFVTSDLLPRECLPNHNCRFLKQRALIAGWPKPKILCWAVKHNQKEKTHTIQVQPPKFLAFLCDFYTKVNPSVLLVTLLTNGLSVSLLQFVLISTYHHCMYYVIFRLLMHLF